MQEERAHIKGILIVLPLLFLRLKKRKLRHAQLVNQMILIAKRIVTAILNTLELFFIGHLCVKLTILVDVLFVFYFLRISQGRECLRVFCFKLSQALLVLLLCYDLLRFAACFNGLQIIRREVLLKVAFCIGNEFGNLFLMRCFNRLCLIEKSLLLGNLCGALIGSNRLVTFC